MSRRFPASLQTEQMWELRLGEARRGRQGEMVEAACQGDESMRRRSSSSRMMIGAEELESRLASQKQQLQLEADRLRQKAVEESRKHIQRELHKKHLEDMAKQVSRRPLTVDVGLSFPSFSFAQLKARSFIEMYTVLLEV